MATNHSHTLAVVEILHYSSDVDAAAEFYQGKLGWPLIWQFKGSLAGFDAGGAYLLTLVAAKFVDGWKEGSVVPVPRLSLQSKDLQADSTVLAARGLAALEISGEPATMLSADLLTIEGIELFIWQEGEGSPATKVVEEYRAKRQPEAIYSLGECVFFVNDKPKAEAFFTAKLGFEVTGNHGDVFCAMQLNGGPILGLYDWPEWWEKPDKDAAPAATRLFLEAPELAKEHSRQVEAGVNPGGLKQNGSGLQWFSIADPDGNTITLWQYSA